MTYTFFPEMSRQLRNFEKFQEMKCTQNYEIWPITLTFMISVKDSFVYYLKNDSNSLHNVIVSWKYRSLVHVVFLLIFKSYLRCTTLSYQMSSGRHAFQTDICSLIGFNSYFVLYLMCCFGNNPLYMDFKPIKNMFCSVLLKQSCFRGYYRIRGPEA